jgi:hypothetical protein
MTGAASKSAMATALVRRKHLTQFMVYERKCSRFVPPLVIVDEECAGFEWFVIGNGRRRYCKQCPKTRLPAPAVGRYSFEFERKFAAGVPANSASLHGGYPRRTTSRDWHVRQFLDRNLNGRAFLFQIGRVRGLQFDHHPCHRNACSGRRSIALQDVPDVHDRVQAASLLDIGPIIDLFTHAGAGENAFCRNVTDFRAGIQVKEREVQRWSCGLALQFVTSKPRR